MRAKFPRQLLSILKKRENRIPYLVGLSFFGYVCFLLVANYLSQMELREASLKRLRYDIDKRTEAVAYYFTERRSDIKNLIASREVSAFFENRALGMTMKYGLRSSLFSIAQYFKTFVENRAIGSDPIFRRILLLDATGKVLVASQPTERLAESDKALLEYPANDRSDPSIQTDAGQITISAPFYFKGVYEGRIIAWINVESLYDHLVRGQTAFRQYVGIIAEQHFVYLPDNLPESIHKNGAIDLAKVSDRQHQIFEISGAGAAGNVKSEMIAFRSPVPDSPLSLVSILPLMQAVGNRSPYQLLVTLVLLAVVFLAGFIFLWHSNLQKLILQTKLEETAHREKVIKEKNLSLAKQILVRKQIAEELTRSKRLAEDASRAKTEFLANMSHELRTPMNHIIGFSELLADGHCGDINDTQSEFLNDILSSSRHLLSLINDVLDLSKVEAGKMELEFSTFSLKTVLEGSLVMIKEKALRQCIQVVKDIGDIPETVVADERKIKQILYNLLSNAVKFTPEGGEIRLHAESTSAPSELNASGLVRIAVSDTGIGLKAEDIDRIFKAFEQSDNSISRTYEGTGLGLPLAKRFIELHGGDIWVESEGEGKGSQFAFLLPINA